jgi:predicted nuclease of restriction endonuclease-like (RecB) superfamily
MRKLYILYKDKQILQTLSAKLNWSQLTELLKFENTYEINYYIDIASKQNLSVRELRRRIKSNEYERLSDEAKDKLINNKEVSIKDNILNPIVINTSNKSINIFNEKVLKELILNDIENFMKQLGNGYSYVGNEYPILLGDRYNYIDLLLFNYIFNCFIVIELKVTELKKEHIGQIETYMHYIDSNIKSLYQNNTIGIIICKKDNKFVMEYCSDNRVFRTTYQLN